MVRSALIFAAGCLSTFVVLSIVPLKTTPSGTASAPPASATAASDSLHVTLPNGSKANYYDPSKTTTAAEAFATMDARATATATARAAQP